VRGFRWQDHSQLHTKERISSVPLFLILVLGKFVWPGNPLQFETVVAPVTGEGGSKTLGCAVRETLTEENQKGTPGAEDFGGEDTHMHTHTCLHYNTNTQTMHTHLAVHVHHQQGSSGCISQAELQDIAENLPVAVNENVSAFVPKRRDLSGEHGAQHGVSVASQSVQGRSVDLTANVEGDGVRQGVTVAVRGV
uniref:Uncharacterized protein n=1 Tax=Oncorhynchus tshawytscha TaxID=74940 RepID=A0A8C8HP93_ONCTS